MRPFLNKKTICIMTLKKELKRSRFVRLAFGLCFGMFFSSWFTRNIFLFKPLSGHPTDYQKKHLLQESMIKQREGLNINDYIGNSEKHFLLIGVITAKKYLDDRVIAAYKTWVKTCSLSCKVIFFSSEKTTTAKEIPLVSLHGVNDAYPPQRKSLLMLKYMHDQYIDNFEWFMRADDDVFVKCDKMERFLRSVNSSKSLFIGQPGRGKKDVEKLFLEKHDNYCMGGPGLLFSGKTLRLVAPHVQNCINNFLSIHEDVEVGRCVHRYAGISCTWAYEMTSLFYHNDQEKHRSFKTTLNAKFVRKALTLHPIKDPQQQYKIQEHFHLTNIEDLNDKMSYLFREIINLEHNLGISKRIDDLNRDSMMSHLTKYMPVSRDNILTWDLLSTYAVPHRNTNPKSNIKAAVKHIFKDNINQVLQVMNTNSIHKGKIIDFKKPFSSYCRVRPPYSADYVLNLLLIYTDDKNKKTIEQVRKQTCLLRQTFGPVEFIEDSAAVSSHLGSANPADTVHFILPLAGKVTVFKRFMTNYEKYCLKTKEAAQLHIVIFNNQTDSTKLLFLIVKQYQKLYGVSRIEVINGDGSFARGKALDSGIFNLEKDALLFFIDVDILYDGDALERIRLNTIKHRQVYYPIVFSQYDPELICSNDKSCNISWSIFSSDFGYWRSFGYGMVSVYKQDLINVGGWDTSIEGWGKEDVYLYSKFVKSNLTIHRSVDPMLVHVFHHVSCDASLKKDQYQMCIGSKASTFGSQKQLSNIIFNVTEILNKTSEK